MDAAGAAAVGDRERTGSIDGDVVTGARHGAAAPIAGGRPISAGRRDPRDGCHLLTPSRMARTFEAREWRQSRHIFTNFKWLPDRNLKPHPELIAAV